MQLYEGREPFVFIGYAYKDAARVFPLVEELQARGVRVWLDDGMEEGAVFPGLIAERMESCACFAAFLTAAALASRNWRAQIGFACNRDKTVLVTYLEEVEPSLGMQLLLGGKPTLHRADYESDTAFSDALCAALDIQ